MEENILFLIWIPATIIFIIAILIAIHHCYIHSQSPNDKARDESIFIMCYLQPSDLKNHEVWVVCLICIALTWVISGYIYFKS
jgi:hypothetical protein